MKIFCDIVYQACKWLLIVIGFAMLAIITVGIISRYCFHKPLVWEYELCIALFIWCTFLGAATAFRDKQHIAFTMLSGALPYASRQVVMAIKNILILVVLAAGIYFGYAVVDSTWYIEYQTMEMSLALSYAALPVGFACSLLFVLESIFKNGIGAD